MADTRTARRARHATRQRRAAGSAAAAAPAPTGVRSCDGSDGSDAAGARAPPGAGEARATTLDEERPTAAGRGAARRDAPDSTPVIMPPHAPDAGARRAASTRTQGARKLRHRVSCCAVRVVPFSLLACPAAASHLLPTSARRQMRAGAAHAPCAASRVRSARGGGGGATTHAAQLPPRRCLQALAPSLRWSAAAAAAARARRTASAQRGGSHVPRAGAVSGASDGSSDESTTSAPPRTPPHGLRWATALSRRRTVAGCLDEAVSACLAALGSDAPPPDVVRPRLLEPNHFLPAGDACLTRALPA
jgi:hypothetical protein